MTEDDWWARVDESPGDPGLFMFFADWLGDQGDPREGAAREVVRRGWVPYHCGNGPHREHTWDWYLVSTGWGNDTGKAQLDGNVFNAFPLVPPEWQRWATCHEYPTPADAYHALLKALTVLESVRI
jgi:uncharacterized protein (TIGR02996 family)